MALVTLRLLVRAAFDALFWLLVIRVLLSWVRPRTYNRLYLDVERFVWRVTEPILGPIRNLVPPVGMVDFSPLVALLVIRLVQGVVLRILP